MPIPKPSEDEDKGAFMSRCMTVLKDEKKPNEQKVAICMTQWARAEASKKKKKSETVKHERTES